MALPSHIYLLLAFVAPLAAYAALLLTRERFRSQRPVIVVDRTSGHRPGDKRAVLKNVGFRVALDLRLSLQDADRTVIETVDALCPGNELSLRLSDGASCSLSVSFRDVAGGYREVMRQIDLSGSPRLSQRARPGWLRRIADALAITSAD